MIILQLSVFLENKPGRLCSAIKTLADEGINISALSLAEADEYGILRLIVDDIDSAKKILNDAGIIVKRNHVIAITMDDTPGGMFGILKLLADNSISIEYTYACIGKVSGKALMILRCDNNEKAEKLLEENGFGKINPADIYRI